MSDSNMRSLHSLVVGTAGHIDHGKTSLVYALTGVDTDRLKEEKQRGISIDLGFAEMQLAEGPAISFVDVPGHERFVRNMLAGAAGMEAVMLIVAANESVMPQTREHFEICRLLGMQHGLVVLTKSDLATPDQLARTRRDVQSLVAGSFLAGAPLVEVSTVTQAGLAELKRHLALLAANTSARNRDGVMRLPIDRVFAVKGFGTVVTGTLMAGSVSVGDTLDLHPDLHPQKTRVRVRGLQAQHTGVERAVAGQRLAVNLAGVEQHDLKRGHVLASADTLAASRVLDVELNWLNAETPPGSREIFVLHLGTAETSVKIKLYPPRFARLRLLDEIIALPGDRFVVRRPSPAQTVGGGVVIDAFSPTRLNRAKISARMEALSKASLNQRIELLLNEAATGRTLADLVRFTGASKAELQAAIAANAELVVGDERAVTRHWILKKQQALLAWLTEFHKANPNATGAPLAAARLGLDGGLTAVVFQDFAAIRIQGETVALSSHRAEFSYQEAAALKKIENAFRVAGFQPPPVAEVVAAAGVDVKIARALLASLVKGRRLIKLPDDLIFHADVIAHVRNSLKQHKGRKFSVAEFKTWVNISRKFAIPLLEYLDQQRVTKREGDVRVVL